MVQNIVIFIVLNDLINSILENVLKLEHTHSSFGISIFISNSFPHCFKKITEGYLKKKLSLSTYKYL